jgi:Ras-related protein Rab-2A
MKEVNFNYLYKYIVIGDSFVGKSCIVAKYIHGGFDEEFKTTIGIEFGSKDLTINGKVYRIQIWDTAGQETFRSITRAYYKNSVCSFIVYDVTNRQSFLNVQDWFNECKKQTPKTAMMVLVGNKIDLNNKREVSYEEGENFAKNNSMLFYETSAKNGDNIENMFYESAEIIANKINEGYYDLDRENCGIKMGFYPSEKIVLKDIKSDKDDNKKLCC